MADLIFLRHGQTQWNQARRLQGHGDSPLTEQGRRQARAHARVLRACAPRGVWCSPLGRARATADIVAAILDLDVTEHPELRERGMGCFEGWTLAEIEDRHPQAHADREADPWHWRAPAAEGGEPGENYDDLLQRTAPLVAQLAEIGRAPGAPLIVVSHGTLIRPLLGQLLGLAPATMLALRQPNGLRYRVDLAGDAPDVFHGEQGEECAGLMLL